jgi:hypothetical protein
MIIESGINPNCSETVFRIPKEYKEIAELNNSLDNLWTEPVDGYSQMRPTKDTICYYFYQTSGWDFHRFLEENKIPYEAQAPFGDPDGEYKDVWEKIELTPEENALGSDGGSGDCYKRKPYGN